MGAEQEARKMKLEEQVKQMKAEYEAKQKAEEHAQLMRSAWEILTDDGWLDVGEDVTKKIKSAIKAAKGNSTVEYSARGFDYTIDVKRMTQMNQETGRVRPL